MTEPTPAPPTLLQLASRGVRRRCPHCGKGGLFTRWAELADTCPVCGLAYEPGPGDTWAFTYIGSGGVTGIYVLLMFLIRPPHNSVERVLYLVGALVLLIGTIEHRKGLAIAALYHMRRRWPKPGDTLPPPS